MNFSFEYPEFFLLIILFLICCKFCKAKFDSFYFPQLNLIPKKEIFKNRTLIYLRWITIISLLTALASPYKTIKLEEKPKNGLNIALLIDTSESMKMIGFNQRNLRLNRFQVVKNVVNDFIQKRTNDNLGLVVFGEYSFIASPLTFDKKILSEVLNNLHIGIAGKTTAIYDAIGQTVALLKNEENATNIAILITDGINTAGILNRDEVIQLAKNRKIKFYTIGIGRMGEINPFDLQDIAEKTGGKFFLAKNGAELKAIYQEIDRLEKRKIKNIEHEIKDYLYFYPLLISLLSLTLFAIKIF
jgi:Ca-activated chloride channel family protein